MRVLCLYLLCFIIICVYGQCRGSGVPPYGQPMQQQLGYDMYGEPYGYYRPPSYYQQQQPQHHQQQQQYAAVKQPYASYPPTVNYEQHAALFQGGVFAQQPQQQQQQQQYQHQMMMPPRQQVPPQMTEEERLVAMADQMDQRREVLVAQARHKLKQRGRTYIILGSWLKRQLGVVHQVFKELNFTQLSKTEAGTWGWHAAWGTGGSLPVDWYGELQDYQRYNHFPCTRELGTKDRLWNNLVHAQKSLKNETTYDFFPRTYLMPQDHDELIVAMGVQDGTLFIIKPKAQARGEGVEMLASIDDLPTEDLHKYLVQEYIPNPYLVNGHKHTLRFYVATTSFDPLRIYMMDEGFVHLATEKYTTDPNSLNDIHVHVTNPDVQGEQFQAAGGGELYMNLTAFRHHLRQHSDIDVDKLWVEIEKVIVKTIVAAEPPIVECVADVRAAPSVVYEVWGFDIMVTTDGKPWVIEVNHTPSTNTDFEAAYDIKYEMVRGLLEMMHPTDDDIEHYTKAVHARLRHIGWSPNQLPEGALSVLIEAEAEYQLAKKRGAYRRIYPSSYSIEVHPYSRLLYPSYFDMMLESWVKGWVIDEKHTQQQQQQQTSPVASE